MATIKVFCLADCDCGKVDLRTWFTEDSAASYAECPQCHNLRAVLSRQESYRAHVPYAARKRFTPHFNTSFGCDVESPEHLRHLQKLNGTEDAELSRVHSDGSCDYTPRDIDTGQAKMREEAYRRANECLVDGDAELDYNEDGTPTVTELPLED